MHHGGAYLPGIELVPDGCQVLIRPKEQTGVRRSLQLAGELADRVADRSAGGFGPSRRADAHDLDRHREF
jgi:hypothetical protein